MLQKDGTETRKKQGEKSGTKETKKQRNTEGKFNEEDDQKKKMSGGDFDSLAFVSYLI